MAESPINVAIEAAKKGGEILLNYFESGLEHEEKDDKTFVTKADKESEAAIIDIIKREFPDHAFLAEESGITETNSPYTWVIDPLDGTSNFVNGLPTWAISIGLLQKGEVIASVVHNPLVNMLVYAEKGKGLWSNGIRSHVSPQDNNAAMVSVGVGKGLEVKEKLVKIFSEFPKHLKTYRYIGSCAFELALVARGGTEGFVSLGNSKWDYAAGVLLVEEGGGKLTNLKGEPWTFEENWFIATNGIIHKDLLDTVQAAGIL